MRLSEPPVPMYPTAPLFSKTFTSEDYSREIAETNEVMGGQPISIYFHFPFCKKFCYFCACNMSVTHDRTLIAQYNEYLKKEIDLIRPMISNDRKVAQLHWGGGTPSYLYPDEIRDIGNYIQKNFDFEDNIEASVEIDPRGLSREHMEALREIGFNRTSFCVQDFNLMVQEAINRVQSGIEILISIDEEADFYKNLGDACEYLYQGLRNNLTELKLDYTINACGSMFTLFFTGEEVTDFDSAKTSDTAKFAAYFNQMLNNNVYLPPSQYEANFVSNAHTRNDFDKTIAANFAALKAINQ